MIEVFTDGGAIPNPGRAGWGVVFVVNGTEKKTLSGAIPHATNNEAELTAAIKAVESFTRPATFTICSDSQYLIKSMTEWIPRRGYQGYKNADLFARLLEACEGHTIGWRWVRGHNKDPFNERADQLASARIFDGLTCESCGKLLESPHLDFDWQRREISCGWCGEVFPMSDVLHE
jgi:ribonuclease HI